MKQKSGKPQHQRVVRTTISLPPIILDVGMNQQKLGGYTSFSNYVQDLIRQRERDKSGQFGQLAA
jgi:hypothetical protein